MLTALSLPALTTLLAALARLVGLVLLTSLLTTALLTSTLLATLALLLIVAFVFHVTCLPGMALRWRLAVAFPLFSQSCQSFSGCRAMRRQRLPVQWRLQVAQVPKSGT